MLLSAGLILHQKVHIQQDQQSWTLQMAFISDLKRKESLFSSLYPFSFTSLEVCKYVVVVHGKKFFILVIFFNDMEERLPWMIHDAVGYL